MATTTTKKTTTRKTSVAKTATKTAPAKEASVESVETKQTFTPKDVDPNQYVIVRNGFQGKLIYQSRKTGEIFEWDGFGAEQEMELRELRSAKNTNKKFFSNNWFMFDEDWIVDYLGLRQYYKHALPIDNFDNIFSMKPSELKETISELSAGQKKSVAYRAKELIANNEIDSLSVISVLEEALGTELIER